LAHSQNLSCLEEKTIIYRFRNSHDDLITLDNESKDISLTLSQMDLST
jgi:hypothetical protein